MGEMTMFITFQTSDSLTPCPGVATTKSAEAFSTYPMVLPVLMCTEWYQNSSTINLDILTVKQ